MDRKLCKIASAALLAGSVTTIGPAVAQSQSDNASRGQSTPSQMEQREDNGGKDWGWIGLLGLAGLAGLRRRREPDLERDPATAKRGPGVYNR